MILSRNMLKRVGETLRVDIPVGLQLLFGTSFLYAAVEEDGSSVLDDSDKGGADVVLLHGCPQTCMSNPVEGLLKVYEDMVLLVLEIFLTEDS